MTKPLSNPFSKERKKRSCERGPGKKCNHTGEMKNKEFYEQKGKLELFRSKQKDRSKADRKKQREQAVVNDIRFKSVLKKMSDDNVVIPKLTTDQMVKFLDKNCSIQVTPSTVQENLGFITSMYSQAVALKDSLPKGTRKRTVVNQLTKMLTYTLGKIDEGRAFEELERFFKCKIQEKFSASKIVDLQQHHEGSSLSMEALDQIGGLREKVMKPVLVRNANVVPKNVEDICEAMIQHDVFYVNLRTDNLLKIFRLLAL